MPTAAQSIRPITTDDIGIATLHHTPDRLTIQWSDGRESPYPAIWLADNRPDRRDRPEGQRLFDAIDLPDDIVLQAVALAADGSVEIRLSGFDTPRAVRRRLAAGPCARPCLPRRAPAPAGAVGCRPGRRAAQRGLCRGAG
jgi:hypothetical protein